jgi:hypothetical protein
MRGFRFIGISVVLICAVCAAVRADVIYLNNGDQITGTIKTFDGSKITLGTAAAGDINIDIKDVKSLATDGPTKVILDDGTELNLKFDKGPDGQVAIGAGQALAQQNIPLGKITKINPPPVVWTGAIVVNGLLAQGQTDTWQFGASLDLGRRSDVDRITAGASYLYGRQKVNGVSTTSADTWTMKGEYDYFFTKKLFGLATTELDEDRVLNLRLRATPGVGLGYQWVEKPDFNFNTALGASWVYEDYSTQAKPNEDLSVRAALHVDKSLFEDKLKLYSDIQYFPSVQNVSNYLIIGTAGLRLAITKTMFSQLEADVDYDSHPAAGSRRTDAKYTLGVGWTF